MRWEESYSLRTASVGEVTQGTEVLGCRGLPVEYCTSHRAAPGGVTALPVTKWEPTRAFVLSDVCTP